MGSGQITKNQINLDLIEIFQFCLKMDLHLLLVDLYHTPQCVAHLGQPQYYCARIS